MLIAANCTMLLNSFCKEGDSSASPPGHAHARIDMSHGRLSIDLMAAIIAVCVCV